MNHTRQGFLSFSSLSSQIVAMSLSLSSIIIPNSFSTPQYRFTFTCKKTQHSVVKTHGNLVMKTRCEVNVNDELSSSSSSSKLGIGSPVIITEAPKMIKTAASVPCLRVNADLVKPGDVGRIVSRKPMDVWAIRFRIGTYLIDSKYFKPLDLDQ